MNKLIITKIYYLNLLLMMSEIRPNSLLIAENTPKSEIEIYNLFKEKLNDDYYVNYKRYWHGKNNRGKLFTREIDFILALKDEGILFIEVKGGLEITYNDEEKQWYSKRSDNEKIVQIENPIEQAKDAMFNFKEKLKAVSGWNKNNRLHYICIFPGMKKDNVKTIGEFPVSLFLFKEDLNNIDQSIKRALSFAGQKSAFDSFDSQQMKIFTNFLDQKYFAEIPFKDLLADANKRIIELSDNQLSLYDHLLDPNNKRIAVSGGAGTGKTILATHLAYEFSSKMHAKVLLLSRNRSQKNFLLDYFKNKEGMLPEVKYIFDLVKEKTREVGDKYMHKETSGFRGNWNEEDEEYFDKKLPEFAAQIFDKLEDEKKYDIIIIDEGQDFNEDWFIAIEYLLREEELKYVVFYDNNQKLFKKDEILSLDGFYRVVLSRNYRNTKKIFNIISKLFEDSKVIPVGPEGLNNPPISIEVEDKNELQEAIVSLSNQLVRREKIDPSDIGFITLKNENKYKNITVQESKLLRSHKYKIEGVEKGKIPGSFSRGGTTYWKGLERDIIIIVNILDIQNLDINSLYVALSRAKLQFIILAESKEIDSLKNKIGLNPPNDMYRVKYKAIRKEMELGIGELKILK